MNQLNKTLFLVARIVIITVACVVTIAGTVTALRFIHSTSQAGTVSSDANSSAVPAIIFIDADGNQMTPMEAQKFLDKLDYRDNEGRKIKADGAPGTSTWQGWCKYVGDCHANDVMSLFEVN